MSFNLRKRVDMIRVFLPLVSPVLWGCRARGVIPATSMADAPKPLQKGMRKGFCPIVT